MHAECFHAIQRFCYFKLPSKADGDDMLQEVALAAWSRRESLRNTGAFKPWLMQIAANKIRDFYRKRARHSDIPFDEVSELSLTYSLFGVTVEVEETVNETLDTLDDADRQVLALAYLHNAPQAEIARQLSVPLGTVKSRLHAARRRFKTAYPYPILKGEHDMSHLPKYLPDYTIVKTDKLPFECLWEELQGWFLVPRLGKKLSWAMYDMPERKLSGECRLEVTGKAAVHGVEGVEITAEQDDHGGRATRNFIAQLTDTHVRFLAESHMRGDVKHFITFIDDEEFLDNWGFGEENCGNDIHPKHKGVIKRDGSVISCPIEKFVLDVVDRCTVTLGVKAYDTIRVMDIECYNTGIVSEQFLDRNGRTILWRRFNRNDWRYDYYKKKWSDKLPDNERLIVNGETYVHWYDCITDYIL